jgi:hypothetical protein
MGRELKVVYGNVIGWMGRVLGVVIERLLGRVVSGSTGGEKH